MHSVFMSTKQKLVHGCRPSNINLGIFVWSFDDCGIHNQSPLLNMQNTIIIKNSSVFGLIYDSLPSLVSFPERQLLVKPNQAYSISFDIFQKSNKALILAMPRLGFNSNFPTKIPDIFFIGLPLLGHENG